MKSWTDVVNGIRAELLRCSQHVGSRELLPDRVTVVLPERIFREWAPVLDQVTAEVGEELLAWADRSSVDWYSAQGPRLEIRLVEDGGPRVEVSFSSVDEG